MLSVGQEKRVSFWELREPSPLQWIDVGSEQMCVCRTSDGVLFATGGDDHKVRVWHFESAKLVGEGLRVTGFNSSELAGYRDTFRALVRAVLVTVAWDLCG